MCKFKFHHFHVLLIIYHMYNATNMVMHIRVHIANHPPQVFLLSKREVSKYVETAAVEQPLTPSPAVRRNVEQVGAQWLTLIYPSTLAIHLGHVTSAQCTIIYSTTHRYVEQNMVCPKYVVFPESHRWNCHIYVLCTPSGPSLHICKLLAPPLRMRNNAMTFYPRRWGKPLWKMVGGGTLLLIAAQQWVRRRNIWTRQLTTTHG